VQKKKKKRYFSEFKALCIRLPSSAGECLGSLTSGGVGDFCNSPFEKCPQHQRIRTALVGYKFKSGIQLSNIHERVTPNKHHTEAKNCWSSRNYATGTPNFLL